MSANEALDNRQIIEKALIVLVSFLASGALGLVRIAVVGAQFGTALPTIPSLPPNNCRKQSLSWSPVARSAHHSYLFSPAIGRATRNRLGGSPARS